MSGDSVVIRGFPKGGPPPEKQINLAYIQAPKIGKRATNSEGKIETASDEPYAWEAREFLRKKLVGKEVQFKKEYTVPYAGNQRECGYLYFDKENVVDSLVSAGLADVIKRKQNADNSEVLRLLDLENAAISSKVGKHSGNPGTKRTVSEIVPEPEKLVSKTFDGIVEHVISGSTMKIAVEVEKNSYYVFIVMLSGIKAPGQGEAFGGEAKFFTESRLLHRDVKVRIEAVNPPSKNATANQGPSFNGSVLCNNNNIAEHLLKEGFAKCMDWSLAQALDSAKLRAAEKEAKQKQLRLWKSYTVQAKPDYGTFTGKVVEIINADALNIEHSDTKEIKKIFLASIRPPPRKEGVQVTRALYDVPFMFEAREFLRSRLIGKKVKVHVDYIQPKRELFPEKVCATVILLENNVNIGEALLLKGLGTTVHYRPDDEARSSCYDALRDAEAKAIAKKWGIHGNPDKGVVRIVDLSSDLTKAKSFMSFLSRGNTRKEAVVEHIFSASRIKVYIPKENCCLNIILAGISAPRASDPYGPESTAFVKSLILQRTVEITVDSQDKVGNFIGQVFHNNKALALDLLKAGYASIRDERGSEFKAAEEESKKKKLNIWKDYKEPEKTEEDEDNNNENEGTNGEVNGTADDLEKRIPVVVTQVANDVSHLFVQETKNGPALAKLMDDLREDFESNPPLPGAYTPKAGDLVAAKYAADGQWYRARIDRIHDKNRIDVTYVDYGNKEVVKALDLAALPDTKYSLSNFPEGTRKVVLALVSLPDDKEIVDDTRKIVENIVFSAESLLMKEEYRDNASYVTLVDPTTKKDIILQLVEDGIFIVKKEKVRSRKLHKLVENYKSAQESAKKNRVC